LRSPTRTSAALRKRRGERRAVEKITVVSPECGGRYEDWTRGSINLDLEGWIRRRLAYLRARRRRPPRSSRASASGRWTRDARWLPYLAQAQGKPTATRTSD
jgi:hypothetical protein